MAEEEESPSTNDHYHAALVLYSLKYVEKSSGNLELLRAKIVDKMKCHDISATEFFGTEPTSPEQDSPPPTADAESNPLRTRFTNRNSSHNDDRKPTTEIEEIIRNYQPPATPPFEALKGLIGECSPPLEKQLTDSDVNDLQSRLTISKGYMELLRPLLKAGEVLADGIPVTVYDREGKEYLMTFKVWQKVHVFTTGWKKFYKEHELLSRQDFVTIWMFRNLQTDGLCFAFTWRRLPVFWRLKRRRTCGAD